MCYRHFSFITIVLAVYIITIRTQYKVQTQFAVLKTLTFIVRIVRNVICAKAHHFEKAVIFMLCGVKGKRISCIFAAVLMSVTLCCMPVSATVDGDVDNSVVVTDADAEEYTEGVQAETGGPGGAKSASMQEIGEVLSDAMTINSEELQAGAKLASPLAKLIRTCISVVMALLSVFILANSIWDIVCISVRPLCQRVATGQINSEDLPSKMAAWASHDALVAIQKAGAANGVPTGGASPAGNFGAGSINNFGPTAMGGFGTPMSGAPAPSVPKAKQILPIYFRKRLVFLVLFGVCLAIFCTSTFTDLGLQLGSWIAEKIGSVNIGG